MKSVAPRALYRKYRPTQLADVVGEEQVTTALANTIKTGRIGHAYLFIGPRGTGKTSVARIFAHAVNGFDYEVEDNYLDIIEIDAASNTGVDNIRELREKAIIAPTSGKYKVYIIDEVHMLTKSAANALLKTLEEPPAHVIFIMATTDAHKVPITITSRTQVHQFKLADETTMLAHLRKIADCEQIKITDDALRIVVAKGGGSFRDSLSLLEQVATLSEQGITAPLIEQMLGLPTDDKLTRLLESHQSGDHATISATLQDLLDSGITPEVITSELISKIIKNPTTGQLSLLAKLTEVTAPFTNVKLLLALLTTGSSTPVAPAVSPATTPVNSPATIPQTAAPEAPETPPQVKEPSHGSSVAESPQSAGERLRAKMAAKTRSRSTTVSANPTSVSAGEAPGGAAESGEPSEPAPTLNHFSVANFSWQSLLDAIKTENSTVFRNLSKADYEFTDGTLHIYPLNNFAKKILEENQNFAIFQKYLKDHPVIIHQPGSKSAGDPQISQISAIMGDVQEVREVDENMPF